MVVKVATDNNWCVGILSNNVPNNFCDSLCSLLQVLLLSRLEIAVQNLDIMVAELQLAPAEIRSQCFHQLQSRVSSRCVPATTTALVHSLIRPEPVEIKRGLQLGLVEADHLWAVVLQQIVDDLLLRLGVETSDIEGDKFELLPLGFYVGEFSINSLSLSFRQDVSSVLSVTTSTSICILIFLNLDSLGFWRE